MRGHIDERGKKLFIGGLHMKTNEESLQGFYSQWGEIVDCVVMKDPQSGKSRGFGFVTYSDPDSIDLAQNNRPHMIDGIKVDSKRAMPKEDTSPDFHASVNRLFVGRLKNTVTNEDLYEYFGQYGSITDAVVIKNPNGESRGFGFVTFEDSDSVDKIIISRPHSIDANAIEVKKAQPKDDKNNSARFNSNRQARPGGRGLGRRGGGGGARPPNSYNDSYNNGGNYSNMNSGYEKSFEIPYRQGYQDYPDYQDRYNDRISSQSMGAYPSYGYNGGLPPSTGGDMMHTLGGYSHQPPDTGYGGGGYEQYDTPNVLESESISRYGYPPQSSGMGQYFQRSGGGPIRGGSKYGRGGSGYNPY